MKSVVSYYQFIDSFSFIFTSLVQDKYFCLRNDFADSFEFFPLYIKLAMLAFLYCLNLKIRCTEKSVTSIIIYSTMTIVNLL